MTFLKRKNKHSKRDSLKEKETTNWPHSEGSPLEISLQDNIQKIKETVGDSDDIVIRKIRISKENINAAIIYTEGLVDNVSNQNFIMESLMIDIQKVETDKESPQNNILQFIKESVLTVGQIQNINSFGNLFPALLSGNVIFLLDGFTQGFAIGMSGWKDRGVTEATTENVVRGPKEAFSESIRTNTALIRRRIKSPNLWMESRTIGTVTQTKVTITYVKGIVNDKILQEVRNRLDRIEIDGILESGYIEELIQDETFTPFPTILHTERPDVVAANLLEGKIAILVDGTPFVLIVPAIFVAFLQSPDDYYNRWDISSLIRLMRYLGMCIALLGPSLYIAITTFHQEMLPTALLISLAAQREGVPFPAFIEALIMEITFEILREAGLRMPKTIGQAVSIVGTLVIGTAAVDAGIVSAAMVIVVSITAISSFVFPSTNMATSIRMTRFLFMGLAAVFGLFGVLVGLIAVVLHLCSLRSFGVPYMSPLAPFIPKDQKDSIFRVPHWGMFSRPRLISQKNIEREDTPRPRPKKQI